MNINLDPKSDIFGKMSSDIQLLQVNFGEDALINAVELQSRAGGEVLVVHAEGTGSEVFLELLPELAEFLRTHVTDGLEHFGDRLQLNFFQAHLSGYLLQVFQLLAVGDQSDVPAVLKLGIEVEELVGDLLFLQLLVELLEELLLLWEDTDEGLVRALKLFAEIFLLVLELEFLFLIPFDVTVEIGIPLHFSCLLLCLLLQLPWDVRPVAVSEEYVVGFGSPNCFQLGLLVEGASFFPEHLFLLPQPDAEIPAVLIFRVDFNA